MNTKDITTKELNACLRKASEKALRENSALGLSYKTIKNGELVEKHPDGRIVKLGKPRFPTVTVEKKTFKLK